jgi:flagellar hook-length control protein FliK
LLLAFFPPGALPPRQLDAPPAPDATDLLPQPLAMSTGDPSFDEESSEATASAVNDKTVAPNQAMLLSLFTPLLWMNTLPPAETEIDANTGQSAIEASTGASLALLGMIPQTDAQATAPTGEPTGKFSLPLFSPVLSSAVLAEAIKAGGLEQSLVGQERMLFDESIQGNEAEAALAKNRAETEMNTTPSFPRAFLELGATATGKVSTDDSLTLSVSEEKPTLSLPSGATGSQVRQGSETVSDQRELTTASQVKGDDRLTARLPAELRQAERAEGEGQTPAPTLSGGAQVTPLVAGNTSSVSHLQPGEQVGRGNVENWQSVVNQVMDGIVANVRDNNHEANIQLNPPELGRLEIQLVVEGERVQARIVTESKDVGSLIQSHLPELKEALQSHRLDLDSIRVDVQTGGGELNSPAWNFRQEGRMSARRQNLEFTQEPEPEKEPGATMAPMRQPGRINVWA